MEVDGPEPSPDWSPDGSSIAYASLASGVLQLFVTSADGAEIRRLTEGPHRSLWPRWSPDGTRLAFFSRRDTNAEDDEIYVLDMFTDRDRARDDPGRPRLLPRLVA